MPQAVDLAGLSTRQLLRLYADLLTELVDRGIVRSRNAPAGDLAEFLVREAYGGELAHPSEKSWDVRTPDRRRLQVKARLIPTRGIESPTAIRRSGVGTSTSAYSSSLTRIPMTSSRPSSCRCRRSGRLPGRRLMSTGSASARACGCLISLGRSTGPRS